MATTLQDTAQDMSMEQGFTQELANRGLADQAAERGRAAELEYLEQEQRYAAAQATRLEAEVKGLNGAYEAKKPKHALLKGGASTVTGAALAAAPVFAYEKLANTQALETRGVIDAGNWIKNTAKGIANTSKDITDAEAFKQHVETHIKTAVDNIDGKYGEAVAKVAKESLEKAAKTAEGAVEYDVGAAKEALNDFVKGLEKANKGKNPDVVNNFEKELGLTTDAISAGRGKIGNSIAKGADWLGKKSDGHALTHGQEVMAALAIVGATVATIGAVRSNMDANKKLGEIQNQIDFKQTEANEFRRDELQAKSFVDQINLERSLAKGAAPSVA